MEIGDRLLVARLAKLQKYPCPSGFKDSHWADPIQALRTIKVIGTRQVRGEWGGGLHTGYKAIDLHGREYHRDWNTYDDAGMSKGVWFCLDDKNGDHFVRVITRYSKYSFEKDGIITPVHGVNILEFFGL